jgi:hypothetical protein
LKYSPKIGRIWLIRLVSGHSVTVPGRHGCAGRVRYIVGRDMRFWASVEQRA